MEKKTRLGAAATLALSLATTMVVGSSPTANAVVHQKATSSSFRYYMSVDNTYALGIHRTGNRYKVLSLEFAPKGYSRAFCFYGKKVGPSKFRGKIDNLGTEASGILFPTTIKLWGSKKRLTVKMQGEGYKQKFRRVTEQAIEDRGTATGSSSFAFKGRLYGKC